MGHHLVGSSTHFKGWHVNAWKLINHPQSWEKIHDATASAGHLIKPAGVTARLERDTPTSSVSPWKRHHLWTNEVTKCLWPRHSFPFSLQMLSRFLRFWRRDLLVAAIQRALQIIFDADCFEEIHPVRRRMSSQILGMKIARSTRIRTTHYWNGGAHHSAHGGFQDHWTQFPAPGRACACSQSPGIRVALPAIHIIWIEIEPVWHLGTKAVWVCGQHSRPSQRTVGDLEE